MGKSHFFVPNQRARHAITKAKERVIVPATLALRGQFQMTIGQSGTQRGFHKSGGWGSVVTPTGFPEIIQCSMQDNGVLLLEFADQFLPAQITIRFTDTALGTFRTATMVEQTGQFRYRAAQPTSERYDAWFANLGNTVNCRIVNGDFDNVRVIDRLYQSNSALDVEMSLFSTSAIATVGDVFDPVVSSTNYREWFHISDSAQGALHESFFSNISGVVPGALGNTVLDTWVSMAVQTGLTIKNPTVGLSVNECSVRLASNKKVLVSRALVVLERTV